LLNGFCLKLKRKLYNAPHSLILLFSLSACSKTDPILPGTRTPVFAEEKLKIEKGAPENIGADLAPAPCEYTIDGANQIWRGKARIFAGLATDAEIKTQKRVVCGPNAGGGGGSVYAGLSTGEVVKVNTATRELEWTADVFADRLPTGGNPFLDIVAAPVLNGGFVYAGGLGGAFCKINDKTGKKVWCLPISVSEITRSTENYNFVKTTSGEDFAIGTDGKAYQGLGTGARG
jgi:outer membrane protein assembly factor BamB